MRKQQWIKNRKTRENTSMTPDESQKQNEVIAEARNKGKTVHFSSLMDLCHLKNSELEPQFQKYKGRVVLRGDLLKDDSGSYAVFTEQGSSASQMTAAKVMDVISRLPGCAGQAADAVSAYTQVKMEDAPSLLKIPKSECPDIWIRLPKHKWPKSWSSMEDPVVPLERNRCFLLRPEHPALHPLLSPLFQVSKGCSHPEFPALIHENAGVTDIH